MSTNQYSIIYTKISDMSPKWNHTNAFIFQEENIIFPVNSGKTQNNKKDPLLLETLLKVLPPSSKVKNYLKQSQINTPMRPISAGYTMTQEKIELDQQKSTGCDFRFSDALTGRLLIIRAG